MLGHVLDAVVLLLQITFSYVLLFWVWQAIVAAYREVLARKQANIAYQSAYENFVTHVGGDRAMADTLIRREIARAGKKGCSPRDAIRRALKQKSLLTVMQ